MKGKKEFSRQKSSLEQKYKGGKLFATFREECRPENQIGAADKLGGLG